MEILQKNMNKNTQKKSLVPTKFESINFEIKGDSRGSLIAIENNKNIPFEIKRIYYIFDTKIGVERGFHAHLNLQQILIAVSGSCQIVLDNGKPENNNEIITLNNPNQGLYISGLIWRKMINFSPDCVLLVLADDFYNESDYIRNYDEFLKVVKSNEQ